MAKPLVIFTPNSGSQYQYLACPVWEVLLHGNRSGGKSLALIMDFCQHVGKGYRSAWRGIIFRISYTQLTDIISLTKQWIPQIFPTARFNGSEHKWTFAEGEELMLRYIRTEDDYWNYHGWQVPFIGFEELTSWAVAGPYLKMMSCNRSAHKDVPRKYRATTNPSGSGFAWVKERFIDAAPPFRIITDDLGQARTHIPVSLEENLPFVSADPLYKDKLKMLTADDPNLYKAWVLGSWDIISGGALSDQWDRKIHVLKPFVIPKTWKVFRSFDWGSTKPWSISYIAECNGEQPSQPEGRPPLPNIPRGSYICINEVYGWNGEANKGDMATSQEISERALRKDSDLAHIYGIKVQPGPADTSIWDVKDGSSIAGNLQSHGCHWTRCYKGAGSRASGLALIRQLLGAAKRKDPEKPHLYFFDLAEHHIRTLPLLQYDKTNVEDIDSSLEDHCYDSLRYGLTRKMTEFKRGKVRM